MNDNYGNYPAAQNMGNARSGLAGGCLGGAKAESDECVAATSLVDELAKLVAITERLDGTVKTDLCNRLEGLLRKDRGQIAEELAARSVEIADREQGSALQRAMHVLRTRLENTSRHLDIIITNIDT